MNVIRFAGKLVVVMMVGVGVVCLVGCGSKAPPPAPADKPAEPPKDEPKKESADKPAGAAQANQLAPKPDEAVQKAVQNTTADVKKDVVDPAKQAIEKAKTDPLTAAADAAKADPKAIAEETKKKVADDLAKNVDALKQDLQKNAEGTTEGAASKAPAGVADTLATLTTAAGAASGAKELDSICASLATDIVALPQIAAAQQPPSLACTSVEYTTPERVDTAVLLETMRTLLTKDFGAKIVVLDQTKSVEVARMVDQKTPPAATYILKGTIRKIDLTEGGVKTTVTRYEFRLTDAEKGQVVLTKQYDSKKADTTDILNKLPMKNVFGK